MVSALVELIKDGSSLCPRLPASHARHVGGHLATLQLNLPYRGGVALLGSTLYLSCVPISMSRSASSLWAVPSQHIQEAPGSVSQLGNNKLSKCTGFWWMQ
jgi:hypothetical protein